MLSPLRNAAYRRLFGAQVAALLGTGLATVALGLLAHDLAGAQAGEILGAIFAIKMIAYVGVAPLASAAAARAPRKTLLIALDVVRACVAGALPFVSEPWHIYALMAVLYAASAAFTPAFQAMIPDIFPDEAEYTKALSLSRLASDLESVASPVIAAALLTVLSFNDLFAGTAVGFVLSAALVLAAALPVTRKIAPRPFLRRLMAGLNLFAHTPRLRALFAASLATSAAGAMAFVNTVVLVQSNFQLTEQDTALALAAFGLGSMAAALTLPPLLERFADRSVIIAGGGGSAIVLAAGSLWADTYLAVLVLWVMLGIGYSLTLTPVGRVLRRSAHGDERPALFAAQFALSHACWLIAYPLAGFVSARFGIDAAFISLAGLCFGGTVLTAMLWPSHEPSEIAHAHADLESDHPHLAASPDPHAHEYIIDDLHPRWPR